MSFFLFKPHVVGHENRITTPDLLIDRVSIARTQNAVSFPLQRLSMETELQTFAGKLRATAACTVVSCGGGPLLGLAIIVELAAEPLRSADIVMARSAWRLRNVVDHWSALKLHISSPAGELQASLPSADRVRKASSPSAAEPNMPRGIGLLLPAAEVVDIDGAPAELRLQLEDTKLSRSLTQTVTLTALAADRWTERPASRYAVGPTGDVTHYI